MSVSEHVLLFLARSIVYDTDVSDSLHSKIQFVVQFVVIFLVFFYFRCNG